MPEPNVARGELRTVTTVSVVEGAPNPQADIYMHDKPYQIPLLPIPLFRP
jgi:hypothetical protein